MDLIFLTMTDPLRIVKLRFAQPDEDVAYAENCVKVYSVLLLDPPVLRYEAFRAASSSNSAPSMHALAITSARLPPTVSLAFLLLFSTATAGESEVSSGPKIDFNVVAESNRPETAPTAERPAYYVLHDAGYVEKGDPLGNDNPPAAAAVVGALRKALASAHYLPAGDGRPAALLLISHWGTLRRDSMAIAGLQELDPNLRARIGLVSTRAFAERIERELLDRKIQRLLRAPMRFPSTLSFAERDVLDLTRDDRYFVVLAAFDYQAATRKEIKPLWRVKLSTRNVGASMGEAIAALARAGKGWYGRNEPEPKQERIPLFPAGAVRVGEATVVDDTSAGASSSTSLDPDFFKTLTSQESSELNGELKRPGQETPTPPVPPAAPKSEPPRR